MTEGKKNLLSVAKVVFSNFTLLGAGVVTSFLLPRLLSMEGYGLYKVFNLYSTYIIILQFGIIEWLYMKYGGKKLEDVNKKEFSGFFKTLFVIQLAVSLLLVVASCVFSDGDVRFIAVALSVNIVVLNMTNLFQYLSQAVQRFTELSTRNVAKAILTVCCVVAIYVSAKSLPALANYKLYIYITIAINFVLLLWYIFTYRKLFVFAKAITLKETWNMVKQGFPLCLSNIISTLLLSVDRQVVSMFFPTTDYAIYSYAYSLLMLISTVVSSVSLVVFSMFKKQDEERLIANYSINIKRVSILLAAAATVYFPLCWFVDLVLPNYVESLTILRIVIPGLLFSAPVTVVMHNYYKTLNLNTKFFKISVIMLAVAFVSGIVVTFVTDSMKAVSCFSVVLMFAWYICTELSLKKRYKISSDKNILYLIIAVLAFYIISICKVWYLGMIIYIGAFLIITGCFYSKNIKNGEIINIKIFGDKNG